MSAMNILPEMTEHKRLLDMHTNILTELIKNIKDRELDKYYENEFDFESCNEKVCIQHMKDILTSSKGTSMDKYRAFLCLYLAKKYMNKQALDTFLQDLKNINIDISAIYFINQLEKLKTMNIHIHVGTPLTHSNSGTTTTFKDQLNTYSNIFIDKGMNILQGAKILLPKRREIKITKLVETLIENKPSSLNEQFVYIDPKTPPSDITTGSNHLERNYIKQDHVKDYIVFVIGGGNYIEVSALKDLEEKMNKKIIYGTTDFVRPENFVQELNQIGHAFSP